MRMLAFAFALPLLVAAGVSKADTFTGCLNNTSGIMNKVAVGPLPASACTGNSQQISWNAEGPQGEQGEQGEPGDDAFFDTADCEEGDIIEFNGGVLECVTPLEVDSRIAFVSSDTFQGDLGNSLGCPDGLAGGDCICEALAGNAGLGMNFKAWLATSTDEPAGANFYHHDGPYVRIDGVMVAVSWEDLTDGTLLQPIEVDEQGGRPGIDTNSQLVFTGTDADGTAFSLGSASCNDWTVTSDPGGGREGNLTATDRDWTTLTSTGCDAKRPIYCFEQQ